MSTTVSSIGEDDLILTSSAHPSLNPVSEEGRQDESSLDLNELEWVRAGGGDKMGNKRGSRLVLP